MRTVCSMIGYMVLFNIIQPLLSQEWSQSCPKSIWKMAKQIQKAKDSVVSIHAFYLEGQHRTRRAGTGFVYSKEGFIVTRDNCVWGADSISVLFCDGRESRARIVYCDANTELAVLKTSLDDLPPIPMGHSSNLSDNVSLAILGNSLGFFPSLTLVKYLGVRPNGMLELSAMVAPGNCGSPLLNQAGENVGIFMGHICRKHRSKTDATDVGLPIERVKSVVDSVLQADHAQKGWIGVSVVDVHEKDQNRGVKVLRLVPGGPAEQGDICVGDVLVEFQGKPIQDARELAEWVQKSSPNDQVEISIQKKGEMVKKNIHVQTAPWQLRR